MVFVVESPVRSDGGIEHEGHQYLCSSHLAETKLVDGDLRCVAAMLLRSRSLCRPRLAADTFRARSGRRATMSDDDYGLPTLDVIEKLGKVSLGLRGSNFAHRRKPIIA
jgi:hypothetical protein